MRGIKMTFLVAAFALAHGKELAVNETSDLQDSMDTFVDQYVNKFANRLTDRAVKALSLQNTNLDDTTLGKPGQLPLGNTRSAALPSLTPRLMASPSSTVQHFPARTSMASLPPRLTASWVLPVPSGIPRQSPLFAQVGMAEAAVVEAEAAVAEKPGMIVSRRGVSWPAKIPGDRRRSAKYKNGSPTLFKQPNGSWSWRGEKKKMEFDTKKKIRRKKERGRKKDVWKKSQGMPVKMKRRIGTKFQR